MPPTDDLRDLLGGGDPVAPTTAQPHLWRQYLTARVQAKLKSGGSGDPSTIHPGESEAAEAEYRAAFPDAAEADIDAIFRPA